MIDSDELLRWAEERCEGADCEADYRAAASRAYYALYHAILENIDVDENDRPEGMGSHEYVILELIQADNAEGGSRLGYHYRNQLWEAKDARRTADYKLHAKFSKTSADNVLNIAEAVIPRIKGFGKPKSV